MKCNTHQCCGIVAELLKLSQDQQRIIQVQKGMISMLQKPRELPRGVSVKIVTPPLN